MTEDRFVIGVDVGTQSAKVMIFAASGEVVAEGHQALRPLEIPAPNRAVHPEDDLWDGVVAAIREAVAGFVAVATYVDILLPRAGPVKLDDPHAHYVADKDYNGSWRRKKDE